MTELRKCPFCGGKAEVWVSNVTDRTVVYCKECDAQIMKPNEQEAIEHWNKRVGESINADISSNKRLQGHS